MAPAAAPPAAAGAPAADEDITEEWVEIRDRLPYDLTRAHARERRRVFCAHDVADCGTLSVSQAADAMEELLDCGEVFEPQDVRCMVLHAMTAVKGAAPGHTPHSDNYVTRTEFRLLICAMRTWLQLCLVFERPPLNDGDVSQLDIRRTLRQVAEWGADVSTEDAGRVYQELCSDEGDGRGSVKFVPVVVYMIRQMLLTEGYDE
eukprot:TRINITY_DN50428_c0_g1_i1.p1 TRINITY_DN50428_c0_g1~~TRINITY_DN50428_c0_g1_i1.p1  ORF type:complete len:204 (+),score=55.55 TRINITY_DN50428_c0_g1_i1:133-744(+)